MNKVVLTIYDSFIVQEEDEELLIAVMNDGYKEVVSYVPRIQ